MSSPNLKQLENAHALFTDLNANEWEALEQLLSPEFKHCQYLPGTITPPDGKETRGKEEWMGALKHTFVALFDHITFRPPLDVIHGTDKVAFHLKSDGMLKSGLEYINEYMITFHFDGEKIIKLNEFVDSKYSSAFYAALREQSKSN
ncbi:hypothetical protein B0H17DRAFT_1325167 [Mycena rosella]|uniref:SnoaL-like domain-containing protein n=1 Tax=Mycena rosella TaxID=1033263 RepID=A0AAD7MAI8_MYCRO|nr:hypothetical protein B0H17DRAFT_1325167 [Mycena rosella]